MPHVAILKMVWKDKTRKEIRFLPCQGGIIKKGTIFNFADLIECSFILCCSTIALFIQSKERFSYLCIK